MIYNQSLPRLSASVINSAANGHWREVLETAGIQLPNGRHHGPCPACGGRDRFRFDDKDGRGTFICNQCGAGDGLSLYSMATGLPIKDAIHSLASILNLSAGMTAQDHARIEQQRQKATRQAEEQRQKEACQRADAARLAEAMEAQAAIVDASEVEYLSCKGLTGFYVLALSRDYSLMANGRRYSYPKGALLAPIWDIHGNTVSAEIITNDAKMALTGGLKRGCAYVIEHAGDELDVEPSDVCVVEGVATGFSVRLIMGNNVPIFCGLSKAGLIGAALMARRSFPGAQIIVCGDVGAEIEAAKAAAEVGGVVSFPPSGDWDDYRAEVAA